MVSPLLIASQPPPLHAVIAVPYNIDENPLNLEDCRSKNRSQQQSHVEVSCNQLTSALRNSSCGDVAVEDEKEKERLARQEMVRFLEARLRAKCHNNPHTEDAEQVPKTARTLEQLLFQKGKDLKAYMDRSTLDTRLRSLMTVLVRRRMCSAAQRQRSQILQRILRDRYVYVRNLVRDITLAKVKKVAKLKCNGVECGPSFGQNLPTAVRNLFFGTTLVHAFEKYSVDRLPTLDWELLIEQAEENLRQFNQWEGMQE